MKDKQAKYAFKYALALTTIINVLMQLSVQALVQPIGIALLSPPARAAINIPAKAGIRRLDYSSEELEDMPLPNAVQFPVIFETPISSHKAKIGDTVKATLKEDLMVGERFIASAGSEIVGRIEAVRTSKNWTASMMQKEKKMRRDAAIKVVFEEIITSDNERIPIVGSISKQTVKLGDPDQPREIVVDGQGAILKAEEGLSSGQAVLAQGVNIATSTGLSQVSAVLSLGLSAVIMGAVGAISPSIVYGKAVYDDEGHPRIKGFAKGAVDSLPGSQVMDKFIFKGSEIDIYEGDELMVQAHSPYDSPRANMSVSAQVVGKKNSAQKDGK